MATFKVCRQCGHKLGQKAEFCFRHPNAIVDTILKSRSGSTLSQDERRASGARIVASFSLPAEVSAQVATLAAKLSVSKSEVVARAVRNLATPQKKA